MALTEKTKQDYSNFTNPDAPLLKPKIPGTSTKDIGKSIRQAKKEIRHASKLHKASGAEGSDISDAFQTAANKLQSLQQQKAEIKGFSQRKMERKGLESGVGDVISSIESSGRKANEKRVPKYNVKGELVGYKVKPGGFGDVSTGSPKDEYTRKSTSGIGQYQSKEYTGFGSRKYLKAAAKKELAKGFNINVSNKKLREALMADEASKKEGLYVEREDPLRTGEIVQGPDAKMLNK